VHPFLELCACLARISRVLLKDFSQLLGEWKNYDLIICGTNCSDYLISYQDLEQRDPLSSILILDLSMPRVIDPSLALHPRITLLNMEEIGALDGKKAGAR